MTNSGYPAGVSQPEANSADADHAAHSKKVTGRRDAHLPIVLDDNGIYTAAEVAAWLRHSVDWFYANRHSLQRRQGFPKPVSRLGQPRWNGGVLNTWAAHAHEFELAQIGGKSRGPNVLDLRTETARLAACAQSGATSGRPQVAKR